MKVAYVSLAPFISGAERCLQLILQHAPAVGIESLVLCPPDAAIIPWCEAHGIRHVGVRLAERDKWHPVRWLSSVSAIARVLRRERVQVVHSNQVWCFAAAGTAAGFIGIPRVCHMRDVVSPAATRWWCKSGVESVLCISRHIERLTAPAWSIEERPPIRTLIDPVPLPQAVSAQSAEQGATFRLRSGVASDAVIFGFIGQISKVKGLLELVHALSGLAQDSRWHLLVAGRDPRPGQPYERECRERIEALGLTSRITFLGFLEDAGSFYHAIDIAVVPSLEEPLGLIPLEAGSFRKPTVAFAVGGLTETIEEGRTGWLVPPNDVQALQKTLAARIEARTETSSAGDRAHEHVRMLCDPDRYMRELAALYASLVQKNA